MQWYAGNPCHGRLRTLLDGVLWVHFRFHQVLVSVGGFGVRERCSLFGSGSTGWLKPWDRHVDLDGAMAFGFAVGLVATLVAQDHGEVASFLLLGFTSLAIAFRTTFFFAGAALLAASSAEIFYNTWGNAGAAAAFCQRENVVLVPAASAAALLPCCSRKNFGKAEGKTQSTHSLCEVLSLFPQVTPYGILVAAASIAAMSFDFHVDEIPRAAAAVSAWDGGFVVGGVLYISGGWLLAAGGDGMVYTAVEGFSSGVLVFAIWALATAVAAPALAFAIWWAS